MDEFSHILMHTTKIITYWKRTLNVAKYFSKMKEAGWLFCILELNKCKHWWSYLICFDVLGMSSKGPQEDFCRECWECLGPLYKKEKEGTTWRFQTQDARKEGKRNYEILTLITFFISIIFACWSGAAYSIAKLAPKVDASPEKPFKNCRPGPKSQLITSSSNFFSVLFFITNHRLSLPISNLPEPF